MLAKSDQGKRVESRLRLGVTIVATIAHAALVGCANTSELLVIDGVQDDDHVNVVKISSSLGGCTGTFLGSGLVLTASHCVSGATSISVTFVDYVVMKSTTLPATEHATLPESQSENQDEANDLATVLVDNCKVPVGINGMRVLDGTAGVLGNSDIGAELTAVGFGATSAPTDDYPDGNGAGTRHRGSITLDSLTPNTARVSEGGDQAAPCHGDSGGPLVVMRGGTEYLAGVVSTGDCTTETTYARADANRNADFIDSAAVAALRSLHDCNGRTPPSHGLCHSGSPSGFVPIVLGAAVMLRRRWKRARRPTGSRGIERADGNSCR